MFHDLVINNLELVIIHLNSNIIVIGPVISALDTYMIDLGPLNDLDPDIIDVDPDDSDR